MTRAGVLDTIDTLLSSSISGMDPAFVGVSRGEPLSIPALPWCAFWLSGLSVIPELRTLGDESTITSITVRSFHPTSIEPASAEKINLEVWNTISGIRSILLSDASLSDNASQIQVNDASVETSEINGIWYVQTTQTIDVWILGDTTITP